MKSALFNSHQLAEAGRSFLYSELRVVVKAGLRACSLSHRGVCGFPSRECFCFLHKRVEFSDDDKIDTSLEGSIKCRGLIAGRGIDLEGVLDIEFEKGLNDSFFL